MARRRISKDLDLDSDGIRQVLMSSELRHAIEGTRSAIASNVRSHPSLERYGVNVIEDSYTSQDRNGPRVAASVTLAGWAGKMVEGRDGVLTQAAAATGLEVRA